MRGRLVLGAAAVTTTVVVAFLVPLALAVRTLASDRALSDAEQAARSVATVFALVDDEAVRRQVVGAAQAGATAELTAFLADGTVLGADHRRDADVGRAFAGASFVAPTAGGSHVLVPVVTASGTDAVIRAFVPTEVLQRGVSRAWGVLAALALGLVAVAVALADWLGRGVVRPVRQLAGVARRLGAGDLDARVEPAGPDEVADVGRALNTLAGRIAVLLAAEREMVADLSHRLRTPLTALGLDAEAVRDSGDAQRLRAGVDALERAVTQLINQARAPRDDAGGGTDVAAVVGERAGFWGALAEDQGRAWDLRCEGELPAVPVPADDVAAALDVLLSNVFSHTPDGTPYWLRLSATDQGVAVEVADAGPGLPPAAVARGASGSGSTGLGLDIARQVAERSGGGLTVGTRPGGGASITITFGTAPPASS